MTTKEKVQQIKKQIDRFLDMYDLFEAVNDSHRMNEVTDCIEHELTKLRAIHDVDKEIKLVTQIH